jgi:hypothetical protein
MTPQRRTAGGSFVAGDDDAADLVERDRAAVLHSASVFERPAGT